MNIEGKHLIAVAMILGISAVSALTKNIDMLWLFIPIIFFMD